MLLAATFCGGFLSGEACHETFWVVTVVCSASFMVLIITLVVIWKNGRVTALWVDKKGRYVRCQAFI